MTRAAGRRLVESSATAVAGGVLAGASWSFLGLGWPAAVVGAGNGAISGWRGIYDWRRASGWLAVLLDSTWGLVMTTGALVAHLAAAVRRDRGGYLPSLSERWDRHVYATGLRVRKGFATTIGNVINGARADAITSPRRAKLVTDHEDVHVWQCRLWGPLFPILYVGWMVAGAVVGVVVWVTRRRHERFGKVVETCAYYLNPFEWWAYSREDRWPPKAKIAGLGWKLPVVRPFSDRPSRRRAGGGRPTPPAVPG